MDNYLDKVINCLHKLFLIYILTKRSCGIASIGKQYIINVHNIIILIKKVVTFRSQYANFRNQREVQPLLAFRKWQIS